LNPWNARIDSLERPDYLVFDLDPVETDFANVIKVAQTIRKILEKIGIESYCKTSGKRGLHIFIPIGAKFDHQSAREIAELLARQVERTMPDIVSLARSPKDRRGCVYIDFLQNKKGTSMAAAYSVRPAPGATVSTPLSWSEVKASLDPAQFTMINMQRRLDKVGDLWKPVLGRGINFDKVMTVLGKSR
jgi:bifunctional non-homologous end joining protein LigD